MTCLQKPTPALCRTTLRSPATEMQDLHSRTWQLNRLASIWPGRRSAISCPLGEMQTPTTNPRTWQSSRTMSWLCGLGSEYRVDSFSSIPEMSGAGPGDGEHEVGEVLLDVP